MPDLAAELSKVADDLDNAPQPSWGGNQKLVDADSFVKRIRAIVSAMKKSVPSTDPPAAAMKE